MEVNHSISVYCRNFIEGTSPLCWRGMLTQTIEVAPRYPFRNSLYRQGVCTHTLIHQDQTNLTAHPWHTWSVEEDNCTAFLNRHIKTLSLHTLYSGAGPNQYNLTAMQHSTILVRTITSVQVWHTVLNSWKSLWWSLTHGHYLLSQGSKTQAVAYKSRKSI